MKVDVIASERHYHDHLLPVFNALPEHMKGEVHPLRPRGQVQAPPRSRVALVASWQDMAPLRHLTRFIYVEHGAGQAYGGDVKTAHWPGYSLGGAKHTDVIGYICPNETVAARWAPARTAAVGCPKLDRILGLGLRPNPVKTVAFAWHWDCRISPESRSAWGHYAPRLREIVTTFRLNGWNVWGHAHPKWEGEIDDAMLMAGACTTSFVDEVLERCDLLIMDNSSVIYEFAALGKPVILLDAPWYRRDVNHGLRFWDPPPGPRCSGPEELLALDINEAHERMLEPAWVHVRESVTSRVFTHTDGRSSERAAEAIVGWLDGLV